MIIWGGDFVITRLKNGNYYVGRVSSEGAIYLNKPNDEIYGCLSWGAEVDRWVEYSHDGELPSEIVGRFSQQLHSTIQRIEPYRQRLLVIALYEKKSDNKEFNIPKLRIGVNNFVRSLNYMELEDLVAVYIYDKHHDQGYKLLPSSCKISQQNIEFRFVASGKKDITCQVKNQKTIEIDHFVEKNVYEKIYVFSGMWNDSDVDELRKKYKEYPHISIIKPSELFKTLEHNDIFTNDFYDFGNKLLLADELNLSEFDVCDKPKKENACKISGDKEFVSFVAKDGLFYSAEFCALILSWHIMDDHIKEKEIIQNILKKLN